MGQDCRGLGLWQRRHRLLLVAVLLLLPGAGVAKPGASSGRVYRITVLAYARPFLPAAEGLQQGLRELGLQSGRDIVYDIYTLDRGLERVEPLLAAACRQRSDLIFSITTPVSRKLKEAMTEAGAACRMPVIFAVVADPLGSGIVADLRHPGGNFTGVSHCSLELLPQRLLLFKQAFPAMRRVVVFFNPDEEISKRSYEYRLLHRAARDCRLELLVRKVRSQRELKLCCRRLQERSVPVDGIFMLPDAFSVSHFKSLLNLSRTLKVPLMVIDNTLLRQGGVMGYSPDFFAVGRQAAVLVKQIFAGISPGEIPVQNADRVKLMVSLREARRLGLTINSELLMRADAILR